MGRCFKDPVFTHPLPRLCENSKDPLKKRPPLGVLRPVTAFQRWMALNQKAAPGLRTPRSGLFSLYRAVVLTCCATTGGSKQPRLKTRTVSAIPVEHRFAILREPCMRTGRAVAAGVLGFDFRFEIQKPGEESPNTKGQRAR